MVGQNVLIKFFPWRSGTFLEIPDKYKHQPVEGVILSLGPRAHHALEVGQKVIATRMDGTYIEWGEDRYCVIPSSGIVLIDDDHPVNSQSPVLHPVEMGAVA